MILDIKDYALKQLQALAYPGLLKCKVFYYADSTYHSLDPDCTEEMQSIEFSLDFDAPTFPNIPCELGYEIGVCVVNGDFIHIKHLDQLIEAIDEHFAITDSRELLECTN